MGEFVLRKFTGFNALEVDCSECGHVSSLENPECSECVNKQGFNFDLLELRKNFSTIYFEKGLGDSLKNKDFKFFTPLAVPEFLNFYVTPFDNGDVISDNCFYKIVSFDNVKYLIFNPFLYNLSFHDLELFSSLVNKVQSEELFLDELDKEVPENPRIGDFVRSYTIGLGLIDELLGIEGVQDLFVNSPGDSCVFFNHAKYGQLASNIFLKNEMINKVSTFLRTRSGRPFDESFPVLHSDINHLRSRVCGIAEPLSFNGTGFAIRKHDFNPFTLARLVRDNFLSADAGGLLWFLVDSETSFLITGSRGSGKTTLLGSLLFQVGKDNRFIIIEDTKELPVASLKNLGFNVEHLRTNSFEGSESFEFSSTDALRTALRLGESVLVIGEVRGEEAKTLFEAMRIGAAGNSVMGTIHGSSAFDTFDRIVNDLKVPPTSFKATDVIINCSYLNTGKGKVRKVVGITEVLKDWFNNPAEENGFFDLMVYNPKNKKYAINDLRKSQLLKRVAFRNASSVNDCIENIKLRGSIIKLIAENSHNNPKILSPEWIVKINSLYASIAGKKMSNESLLNEFRNYIISLKDLGSVVNSVDDNPIISTLISMNAVNESSSVLAKDLFENMKNRVSRSTFNKLLTNLESKNAIKGVKSGNSMQWFIPEDLFKFLKS